MQVFFNLFLLLSVSSMYNVDKIIYMDCSQSKVAYETQSGENKQVLPKVHFELKVLKEANETINEIEDAATIEVTLFIGSKEIDKYLIYGDGEIEGEEILFYFPELGSKTDMISYEMTESQITVMKTNNISGMGEQYDEWTRTYIKSNETWKLSKCEGECD